MVYVAERSTEPGRQCAVRRSARDEGAHGWDTEPTPAKYCHGGLMNRKYPTVTFALFFAVFRGERK